MAPTPEPTFRLPARPLDARDQRLIGGDHQLFFEFLEPFSESLTGLPATLLKDLAVTLHAYYIADTLAYLTRMLPPKKEARFSLIGRRGEVEVTAPSLAVAQGSPQKALEQWAKVHQQSGGLLLYEARALVREISVVAMLEAQGLIVPPHVLGKTRYPEELPNAAYLEGLIVQHLPEAGQPELQFTRGYEAQMAQRAAQLQQAFEECWIGFAVRFLRVQSPNEASRVAQMFAQDGAAVADSLVRMSTPITAYRKRRLEALAIFQELVAPKIAGKPWGTGSR